MFRQLPLFAVTATLTFLVTPAIYAQLPEAEDPVGASDADADADADTSADADANPDELGPGVTNRELLVVTDEATAGDAAPAEDYEEADYGLEDRLLDLEERLDQVERRTLLDRVQFGGDYRMILNTVSYRGPSPDPYARAAPTDAVTVPIEETNAEIWSHRFRLSLVAEPVDSVRITGRLTMYKLFGNSQGPAFVQDSSSTRVPRDAGVRFDTIWLDWFVTDWLSLSGGRIAYAGGNPGELRENSTVRRATWGLHMVDGEYDTANLTLSPTDWFRVRGFYASWFNPNTSDVFGGFPFLSSGTDNLRIFGGNVELSIPGIGKNFIQAGYYAVPEFRPFQVPIPDPGFDPSADYTHAPAPLDGSLLFPAVMPPSLGSYMNGSALVELYDIGGSGLDLFVSGSVGYLQPNGQGIAYDIPADPTDPNSARVRFPFLFLASEGDEGLTYFAYAGLRYTVPLEALNEPKLGFEFNHGSRYHISFAVQTDNLLTKLNTRGSAYEAYLILPINEYLFFRAAYLFIDQDYAAGFFGPNPAQFGSTAPSAPAQIHSLNLVLNASI